MLLLVPAKLRILTQPRFPLKSFCVNCLAKLLNTSQNKC